MDLSRCKHKLKAGAYDVAGVRGLSVFAFVVFFSCWRESVASAIYPLTRPPPSLTALLAPPGLLTSSSCATTA